jgi:hypothetical protein
MGRCKLGWLKSGKNPNPKSLFFFIKMGKNIEKSILSGAYVVINQLLNPYDKLPI